MQKLHPQYWVFYRKTKYNLIKNSASLKRISILVEAINLKT